MVVFVVDAPVLLKFDESQIGEQNFSPLISSFACELSILSKNLVESLAARNAIEGYMQSTSEIHDGNSFPL